MGLTTPDFVNPNFDTMYPSRLVNRIHPYEPGFETMGTYPADWLTRRQQTMPISISRLHFIREYHLRGQHQNPNLQAIAQQALQLMDFHPQQENDHSTKDKAAIEMACQNEQQDVDNSNLSASNQDQGNFGTTAIPREFLNHSSQKDPYKRQLSEDEGEKYLCERIKRMRLDVDVLGYSNFGINNSDRIIMEPSQAQLSTTNQQTPEGESTPTDTTKSGQDMYLGVDLKDPKAVWERLEWLNRNEQLQIYFEKQSNPTRTESHRRFQNWLDNLSTPLEAAIGYVIEEAIQEAIETATGSPIETPQIVNTIAQGRLFSDYRVEENDNLQEEIDDQEDVDSIRGRISLTETGFGEDNNSQGKNTDKESDNHNGHDDDKSQDGDNSEEDGGGEDNSEGSNSEGDNESHEDDNVSDSDVDEQDAESAHSEGPDEALYEEMGLSSVIQALRAIRDNENSENDILEDSDLDVDVEGLEPMNTEDIDGVINEMAGYAVVYEADHHEHAQNEPQQQIRVPLGELSEQELRQRNNQQPEPEEVQAEDPIANDVRTQRVRIFLRNNMYRSEEAPANEEEEELQDAMQNFQIQQLVEEAEPQPLRRSERIRRRQQQQQDDEEFENRPLPPHAGPQNPYQMEIDGQEFDHQRGEWVFNGTFENMNWNFMSDVMRW